MLKVKLIILILFFNAIFLHAQEKHLAKSEVSVSIQNYISNHYPKAQHLKYYQEKDSGRSVIECNFIQIKKVYSLKFLGDSLIETELELQFTDFPETQRQSIKAGLDTLFTGYKIVECQEVNPASNPIFEIAIKTKKGQYFECYFNQLGVLIRKEEIILNAIPSQF